MVLTRIFVNTQKILHAVFLRLSDLGLSEFARLLMGLYTGGWRDLNVGQKKVNETTDIVKENENLYLKCVVRFVY